MIARQSMVVREGIRVVSPFAIVVGVMLFFSGHNQPGGGFSAGLVFGAVIALRSIVGLPVPTDSLRLMAIGGGIVVGVAVAPMFFGDALLDQVIWETTLPVLGKVKAGTALIFDLGVTVVVVGLVVALLRCLGAGFVTEPEEAAVAEVSGPSASADLDMLGRGPQQGSGGS